MTRHNLLLTALLVAGVVIPGVALASGPVPDLFFGGIMLKVAAAISLFLLLNNIAAHLMHRKQ